DGELRVPLVVADERDGELRPEHPTVLAQVALLKPRVVVLAADHPMEERPLRGEVVRMRQLAEGDLTHLAGGVTEHRLQRGIVLDPPPPQADERDPRRRAGENGPESRLTLAACLLGPLALDELSNLVRECRHGEGEVFVAGLRVATEELRHSDDAATR